mmetsp:Transcript_88670/g.237108  ORF Transcript_88670/g.237108 Transcript_88670/m.237108 type:complete len:499 (+) Transcript_88670:91-1587(+)
MGGLLLAELQRYEEAHTLLTRFAERSPESPLANYALLCLYASWEGHERMPAKFLDLARRPAEFFHGLSSSEIRETCKEWYDDKAGAILGESEPLPPDEPQEEEDHEAEMPEFPDPADLHPSEDPADAAPLQFVDILLKLGLASPALTILEPVAGFPILTERSLQSERVTIQKTKAYMLQRRFEDGARELTAMLQKGDRHRDAWYLMGECLYQIGNMQDAASAFETGSAFLLAAADPVPALRLGTCYLHLGRWKEAHQKLNESIEIRPTALAWQGVGMALYRSGELARACEALQEANYFDPENAQVWANLAMVCCRQGPEQTYLAKQSYRFAMARQHQLPFEMLVELGRVLLYQSELSVDQASVTALTVAEEGGAAAEHAVAFAAEAEQCLIQALKRQDSGEAHEILGDAYAMQLKPQLAVEEWRLCIAFYAADPPSRERVFQKSQEAVTRKIHDPDLLEALNVDVSLAEQRHQEQLESEMEDAHVEEEPVADVEDPES